MTPARWSLLASLYVTQFLALGFFFIALMVILRQEGAPLDHLSIIPLLGLVWVVKVLWAPLVDRIRFGRLGHYRGWAILTQAGLVVTLLVVGLFDPVADFPLVFGLCVLVAVLSATQDIAADALACRMLPPEKRGVGNGLQIGGGLLGNMIGGGGVLMLYPHIGWQGCMAVLAAGVMPPLLQLIAFREPRLTDAGEPRGDKRREKLWAHTRRLWMVWRQPGGGRWLVMLLLYPFGLATVYYLMTPMLVDAGWSTERIGFTLNVVGAVIGVGAALGAGWLILRLGRKTILFGGAVAQVAVVLAFLIPASGHTHMWAVLLPLTALFLFYSPMATIMTTLMMDRVSPAHAGTDFTVQYSLYTMVATVAGASSFQIAAVLGYQGTILVAGGIAALSALCAPFLYRPAGVDPAPLASGRPRPAETD